MLRTHENRNTVSNAHLTARTKSADYQLIYKDPDGTEKVIYDLKRETAGREERANTEDWRQNKRKRYPVRAATEPEKKRESKTIKA